MALNRKQIILISVLGVLVAAWALDAFVLRADDTAEADAAEALLVQPSAPEDRQDIADLLSAIEWASDGPRLTGLAGRLDAARSDTPVRDAFKLRGALMQVAEQTTPEVVTEASRNPTEPVPAFRVSSVMTRSTGAFAKINGVRLNVGDAIEGWTFVGVQERSAVLEKDGRRIIIDSSAPDGSITVSDADNPAPDDDQ